MQRQGFLTRLINGQASADKCKRWPSDHNAAGGYTLIIPSCTGQLSTTSVPLAKDKEVPAEHEQQRLENLKRAEATLAALSRAGRKP